MKALMAKCAAFWSLTIFISSCSDSAAEDVPPLSSRVEISAADSAPAYLTYQWHAQRSVENLCSRIPVPKGFTRIEVSKGSCSEWLRFQPVKPGRPAVLLFNGERKSRQDVHELVIDIDAGKEDLQQCADAALRMRAEYLFSVKRAKDIHFNFTSGHRMDFLRWSQGYRPLIKGNSVSFKKSARPDSSYSNLRSYLRSVFMYAGTSSLSKELKKVSFDNILPGDVVIQGGFPGHAVLVSDVCVNSEGKRLFLLQQSYMPAQEIHVLRNLRNEGTNPWHELAADGTLYTAEWTFRDASLMRWEP
jgi:hypothetical protein